LKVPHGDVSVYRLENAGMAWSGGEALDDPVAGFFAAVAEAVVKTATTALPELDGFGGDAITAPVRRERDFQSGVLFFDGLVGIVESGAGGKNGALGRSPGAELAGDGTAMEIGGGLLAGKAGDGALDNHLAFHRDPRKQERGAGIDGEFAAFAAVVVSIKYEAAPIDALEENDAGGWVAIGRGEGTDHGVGLGDFGGLGLLEPFVKLTERIAGQVLFEEPGERVVFA